MFCELYVILFSLFLIHCDTMCVQEGRSHLALGFLLYLLLFATTGCSVCIKKEVFESMLAKSVLLFLLVALVIQSNVLMAQENTADESPVQEVREDVANQDISDAAAVEQEPSNNIKKQEMDSAPKGASFFKKITKESKRSIRARLFASYKLSDEPGDSNHFDIESARLNFSWTQADVLKGVLKYDFSNIIDGDEVKDGLRDLYVQIQPVPWIGLQFGQFKKPFSQLELTSRSKLSTVTRGESNGYMVDFLHYGGRDLGAMLQGRLVEKIKFDYAIGVFNGNGPSNAKMENRSKDFVARLDMRPVKWLSLGTSISAHRIETNDLESFFDPEDFADLIDDDFPDYLNPFSPDAVAAMEGFKQEYDWLTGTHWMGELDAKFKRKRFEALVEVTLGQNWWFKESPYIWSVSALLNYEFRFKNGAIALEPVLLGELMHIEDETWTWRARMLQVVPGVNLHFGKNIRLMVQGQFVRTQGGEADFDEANRLGFWPGEWPGSFISSSALLVQLAYAN